MVKSRLSVLTWVYGIANRHRPAEGLLPRQTKAGEDVKAFNKQNSEGRILFIRVSVSMRARKLFRAATIKRGSSPQHSVNIKGLRDILSKALTVAFFSTVLSCGLTQPTRHICLASLHPPSPLVSPCPCILDWPVFTHDLAHDLDVEAKDSGRALQASTLKKNHSCKLQLSQRQPHLIQLFNAAFPLRLRTLLIGGACLACIISHAGSELKHVT